MVHAGGTWTYAQLERATRSLAVQLLAQPADNAVVALHAGRCAELPIAMLACMRAGLTFAVLDAAYPAEKLEQLRALLTPGRSLTVDAAMTSGLLDADLHDDRIDRVSPDSIAYLLFTSGTTGVPKCIATAHAPLVHFIDWYAREFAVDGDSRFSMLSGLGHDPILRDIFVPLSLGAQLHVPEQAAILDPAKLHAWIAEARITHAHVTPQLCRILCAGRRGQEPLSALRFVLSGGDSLRTRQASDVLAAAPDARVVNFYGATETPQAMGYHVFDPREDTGDVVPVGRGIADVQLAVLDDALQLAPVGVRGQIAIRTRFLSAGYLGDPALTDHKFITNPQTGDPRDRVYLTGDVGRFRDDGAVVVDGRMDDQIKIRGFRVELGDVAHQLERIATVKEAIVLAERGADGENRLVAYLVARAGSATDTTDTGATAAVRDAMSATAPAYMVPARCIWLPQFPLLPNGKVDRAVLARLAFVEEAAEPAEPENPIEATIVAQWKEILGRPGIDVDASFVDLGGDSLSFIEASVQVETLLGRLPDHWERLSIRQLARQSRAKRGWWTRVDSSVLLRAISIVAVVVGHFDLPDPPGSVRALFVVSGMSFGKYLVPQVLRSGHASPIFRLVTKIAVPAVLYTIFINIVFHHPKWPGLLMITNLVSPDSKVGGIGFWFIDVLAQSLVFLALLLSVARVRELVSRDPFAFALGATAVFDVIGRLAPLLWDTSHLYDRVPQHHLGAICLGWALVHADTLPRKLVVGAATVLTFGTWNTDYLFVFPFVATFVLVTWQRVALPVFFGRLVHVVATASLFIYLTDHQSALVLSKLGLHPAAGVPIAVAVGVATRKLWETTSAAAVRKVSAR